MIDANEEAEALNCIKEIQAELERYTAKNTNLKEEMVRRNEMPEWKVVAILDMSIGNESVGAMWQETRVFKSDATLMDVMEWAAMKKDSKNAAEHFRGNLKLTIVQ